MLNCTLLHKETSSHAHIKYSYVRAHTHNYKRYIRMGRRRNKEANFVIR